MSRLIIERKFASPGDRDAEESVVRTLMWILRKEVEECRAINSRGQLYGYGVQGAGSAGAGTARKLS
jgi:hypothetical protein